MGPKIGGGLLTLSGTALEMSKEKGKDALNSRAHDGEISLSSHTNSYGLLHLCQLCLIHDWSSELGFQLSKRVVDGYSMTMVELRSPRIGSATGSDQLY